MYAHKRTHIQVRMVPWKKTNIPVHNLCTYVHTYIHTYVHIQVYNNIIRTFIHECTYTDTEWTKVYVTVSHAEIMNVSTCM